MGFSLPLFSYKHLHLSSSLLLEQVLGDFYDLQIQTYQNPYFVNNMRIDVKCNASHSSIFLVANYANTVTPQLRSIGGDRCKTISLGTPP